MKTNVKLKFVVAKWDEAAQKWFAELTYEFEEDGMIMERIFPKVELPFPNDRLPSIISNRDVLYADDIAIAKVDKYEIECSKYAQLFEGKVDGITDLEVTYIDQVVGPIKPKELTITQIEALLGYKIKIINDKESE